jgi:hypothetical protein
MAKRKRRLTGKKPFHLPPPEPKYPIATVAYYGPDDRTPTKIAVGGMVPPVVILAELFADAM